jgi:hypothetical protein
VSQKRLECLNVELLFVRFFTFGQNPIQSMRQYLDLLAHILENGAEKAIEPEREQPAFSATRCGLT